jgi:hypothetical protein
VALPVSLCMVRAMTWSVCVTVHHWLTMLLCVAACAPWGVQYDRATTVSNFSDDDSSDAYGSSVREGGSFGRSQLEVPKVCVLDERPVALVAPCPTPLPARKRCRLVSHVSREHPMSPRALLGWSHTPTTTPLPRPCRDAVML